MNVWDIYQDRIESRGKTKYDVTLKREKRQLNRKLPDSLSYHQVTIFDEAHGYNITSEEMSAGAIEKNVAIINSDNLNEKYIFSLPDDDICNGDLVHWMDNYWLVTERDANTTVYTRAKMIQCNYLLRWVSDDNTICEQWCVIEDGTKLKHMIVCNSLVCWKRHTKRIPLIAGNPLETFGLQHRFETVRCERYKNQMYWAISSQASNRGRFRDYPGRGSRHKRVEMGNPKPSKSAW